MSILKTILDCGKEIFLPRDREPVFRLFARKQELFQKNKTERKVFLRENYRGEKQLVIPDGYEEIGFNALEKCRRLESVTVPGSVKTIQSRAFAECPNLKEVTLCEGIKVIDTNVFTDCPGLKSVVIPDSVEDMRGGAFYKSGGLTEPVYNASKTVLYYYPASIAKDHLVIPEGVERIATDAFIKCGFSEVTIPSTIKKMDRRIFCDCENLKTIRILCDPEALCKGVFSQCDAVLLKRDGSRFPWLETLKYQGESLTEQCVLKKAETTLNEGTLRKLDGRHIVDLRTDHIDDILFRSLAEQCGKGDTKAMLRLAEYFHKKADEKQLDFYAAAENFWMYFASESGDENAKKWVRDWTEAHPYEFLPTAISVPISGGFGYVLNALGFFFFEPGRYYNFKEPDEDGVVEVCSYADEDGPDEDGFGREIYFDWWYLTDCLSEVPEVGCFSSYSNLDRRNLDERFKKARDKVALFIKENTKKENGIC